jgi:hypothetical protein
MPRHRTARGGILPCSCTAVVHGCTYGHTPCRSGKRRWDVLPGYATLTLCSARRTWQKWWMTVQSEHPPGEGLAVPHALHECIVLRRNALPCPNMLRWPVSFLLSMTEEEKRVIYFDYVFILLSLLIWLPSPSSRFDGRFQQQVQQAWEWVNQ